VSSDARLFDAARGSNLTIVDLKEVP